MDVRNSWCDKVILILILTLTTLLQAGCRSAPVEDIITVKVIADGKELTLSFATGLSVEELLSGAQIELGDQDRVSHPLNLQIREDMRITVRRVSEVQTCLQESLPYSRRYVPYEGIPSGQERLGRSGSNGLQETCYRTILEDDVETRRIPIGQPIVLDQPVEEIIYIGPADQVDSIDISGRLSYINNGTAWTIQGNTTKKLPMRKTIGLDSLVFSQNANGMYLIYSTESDSDEDFINELWLIAFSEEANPIKLPPTDVLYAEWRPGTTNTVAYSTGEAGQGSAAWKSLNNLWLMQIDRLTGSALSIDEIIPERIGGTYGWWGTAFRWSPRGDKIGWVHAEASGVVEIDTKRMHTLQNFSPVKTSQAWVWLSSLSWSHDNQLIAATVHGTPLGSEPADTSPVFDLVVSHADGGYSALIKQEVGIWAAPAYSPNLAPAVADYAKGYLAWLQAREPYSSINTGYDLIVADRDGSNQRAVFPAPGMPGIRNSTNGLTAQTFVWSPGASFIAIIYEGNLWLVEVETEIGYQVTFDGGASNPVWTR